MRFRILLALTVGRILALVFACVPREHSDGSKAVDARMWGPEGSATSEKRKRWLRRAWHSLCRK